MIKKKAYQLLTGLFALIVTASEVMAQGPTPSPSPTTPPPTPSGAAAAVPLTPEIMAVMAFLVAMTGIWFILRKRSNA